MKIFIDPGHNYSFSDLGAYGNGLNEQDITFYIAEKLAGLLKAAGETVKMSRNTREASVGYTVAESINGRCRAANEWQADLFVSIHCNAGGGTGTETLVYSNTGVAKGYAEKVQKAICSSLDLTNRGVKIRKDLGVLKNTNMPAILVETAFIDNKLDAEKLKNRQNDFAAAIFTGITGMAAAPKKLTEINDLVWELSSRGIISDKDLWLTKLRDDKNAYFLAQKTVSYVMEKGL